MAEKPAPLPSNYKHIVRIANIDIPGEKPIRIALCKIKGIGLNFADATCIIANIDRQKKTGTLSDEEVVRLNDIVANPAKNGFPTWMLNRRRDYTTGETSHLLTGSLIFTHDNDLKRLKKIRSYRGVRHMKGLTVRGQRTKSNFRKNKGKVVAVAKKKEAAASADKGKK